MKNPNRIYIFLLVAIVALSNFSCNKDGVFKPKEKISTIYSQVSSNGTMSEKTISESWTWDNNKLTRIDHYQSDTIYLKDYLTYDGKQITRYESGDYSSTFIYDGSKLKTIEIYFQSTFLMEKITVMERDGKNITKLSYEMYNIDTKGNTPSKINELIAHNSTIMSFFVPKSSAIHKGMKNAVTKMKSSKEDIYVISIDMTYTKDNVVEANWVYPDNDRENYVYTYDNNSNPFYKFSDDTIDAEYYSKNNVTAVQTKYSSGETIFENYAYEYDGKWPVKCTQTISDFPGYSFISFYTYQ